MVELVCKKGIFGKVGAIRPKGLALRRESPLLQEYCSPVQEYQIGSFQ